MKYTPSLPKVPPCTDEGLSTFTMFIIKNDVSSPLIVEIPTCLKRFLGWKNWYWNSKFYIWTHFVTSEIPKKTKNGPKTPENSMKWSFGSKMCLCKFFGEEKPAMKSEIQTFKNLIRFVTSWSPKMVRKSSKTPENSIEWMYWSQNAYG